MDLRHLYAVRLALGYLGAIFGPWLATGCANAAHTQASLVLSSETARPDDTLLAGIHLRMDAGWHTYWQNPGASGMPSTIEWKLPAGITAEAPQWPIPEKLPDKDLTTYIYRDEVVILVPLKLAPNLASGEVHLSAKVSWLECAVQCVPGQAEVQADLKIGTESRTSPAAALLETWKKKLPRNDPSIAARGWWEKPATGDLRPVLIEWNSTSSATDADFFPNASDDFEVQGEVDKLSAGPGKIRFRKVIKKLAGNWPGQLSGLIVQG